MKCKAVYQRFRARGMSQPREWLKAPRIAKVVLGWGILLFLLGPYGAWTRAAQNVQDTQEPAGLRGQASETPTRLYADQVDYDRQEDIVFARGKVEVTYGGAVLFCDEARYDRGRDRIYARGHVWLRQDDGNLVYVDEIDVSGDLKSAQAVDVRGIMTDASKYRALQVERRDGTVDYFSGVLYSPCHVCRKAPEVEPTWQLRSRNMVYDEEEDTVYHYDSTMEIKGVPVMYLPYLHHPGPKTKRKSGFLTPILSTSSDYGPIIGAPYFWAIAGDKDVTLIPYYNHKNPLFGLRYRQVLCRGWITMAGTITSGAYQRGTRAAPRDKNGFRGYGAIDAAYHITDQWHVGLKWRRASDETFLKRYQFLGYAHDLYLSSRLHTEGFFARNYFLVEGLSYQSLNAFDRKKSQIPYVAPHAEVQLNMPTALGGNWIVDASLLNVVRKANTRTQRLSAKMGYERQDILFNLIRVDSYAWLRGDGYHVSNLPTERAERTFNVQGDFLAAEKAQSRFIPTFTINAGVPFLRSTQNGRIVIEPKIGVTLVPGSHNGRYIPNEDSAGFELSDVNIFLPSRTPGRDIVDDMSRISYGMHFRLFSQTLGNSELFLGQTYHLDSGPQAMQDAGLGKGASDYVGSLSINYGDWLNVSSQILFQKDTLSARRNVTTVRIGPETFNVTGSYTKYQLIQAPRKRPEQIQYGLNTKWQGKWHAGITATRALGRDAHTLSTGITLGYDDDCLNVSTTLQKTFFHHRDTRPALTFMLRFNFKNLGTSQLNHKTGGPESPQAPPRVELS